MLRGFTPGERCNDSEFPRRVYLDLTGRIPPVAAVRRFLANLTPDKRAVLVEREYRVRGAAGCPLR
jgi:hypothetical protein